MGIYFSISGLIFIIIFIIYFFAKTHVKNIDTNIYGYLLITTFVGILFDIIIYIIFKYGAGYKSFSFIFLSKSEFAYYEIWLLIFGFYIYSSIYSQKNDGKIDMEYIKKIKNILIIIGIAIYCIIFILPSSFSEVNNVIVPGGIAITISYIFIVIEFAIILLIALFNFKYILNKKYIPLLFLIIGVLVLLIIQAMFPDAFILNFLISIMDVILFFTIENPDVRLVEYEKREKELAISASEAKSAFLSSMSHELRTPLNAIVGLSEDILSYKDQVPQVIREDSIDIVNASNTLLELIGNILDISKIEGGKLELVEADYLPHEEIESLLKIMRTKMEEKNLDFNIYIDPNIPECLYGDRLRIKQIIKNFLSNAAKYTEKGSVSFGVRWINNGLQIRVADTGRGIKEEDKPKLFEKFERLHVEKTSSVQGTGLGLAITKNLVDLMGGTISVASVYEKGSTFDVFLPQKIGNKENIVRENLSVEDKLPNDYTGKKVLVVDDNKLNIKVLKKAIATFNFEIDECYDGKQALDKINANKYDLILMDIMMPVMGGEETMSILNQKSDFNTPVIALTADATTGAKERYLACGFKDYLAKPFSRDIISQKLDNVLGNTK